MIEYRGHAVEDLCACTGNVEGAFRQADDDEHQAFGAQRRRLVDCAKVVLDIFLPALRHCGRKHAAPAKAGDPQARIADAPGRLVKAAIGHLVAPRADAADLVARATLDELGKAPALAHGCAVDRQERGIAGKIAHGV